LNLHTLFTKSLKLLHIARRPYTLRALWQGVAAGVEHEKILRLLDCACVVDIGANRGQFALVSRLVWPQAQIYSFEPLPGPAAVFRKIFKNDSRVKLFPCAVAPRRGSAVIHVSRQDDSSSLLPISIRQSALFPGTEEKETRAIEVSPLQDCLTPGDIPRPALLKIDVQGYELPVLQGCESLLSCFDYIYVECSFVELYTGQALAHQVIDYLHPRGFCLRGVYNPYQDRFGLAIQGDFLFAA
jgi:FkbM family methyltransferase